MIGSPPFPKTASEGVACSIAGSLFSSASVASVTEAQAKEREAIAIIAKRDLKDFIVVFV